MTEKMTIDQINAINFTIDVLTETKGNIPFTIANLELHVKLDEQIALNRNRLKLAIQDYGNDAP